MHSKDSDQTEWVDAQADPSLHWAHRSFCFVMLWLNFHFVCFAMAHLFSNMDDSNTMEEESSKDFVRTVLTIKRNIFLCGLLISTPIV